MSAQEEKCTKNVYILSAGVFLCKGVNVTECEHNSDLYEKKKKK